MATRGNNGNKPDLSDLKARLGLAPTAKPPGAAGPPPGAQAPPGAQGPPGAQQGPPGGAQRAPQGAPQQYAAPQQAAPQPVPQQPQYAQPQQAPQQPQYGGADPTANMAPLQQPQAAPQQAYAPQPTAAAPAPAPAARPGPPPGARRPKAKRDLSSLPVHDVQIDESVAERPVFSPAVIGLIVGVLVVGVIFGYMFAQSSQARGLYDNQTEAAKDLAEILKPKVEASQQVVKLVATMDSSKPEYDKTSKLNEIKFVPEAGTITSKTVFLGGGIIYDTTTFMSKASTFKQLIKRHAELTEKDKDELDQLMQGNELLSSDKGFAILFNEKPLVEFASKEKRDPKKFQPKPGTLVSINEFKVDDEGKVAFTHLGSENGGTWPVEGVLPLKKTDLLKTAGTENALARYKRRVDTLKRYALDLNKHVDGVLEPVQEVAQRGGAPVLQLSAPDAPSGASKPAEPAKE